MPHTEPIPPSTRSTDVTEAPPPVMLFLPANVLQALGFRAERKGMTASAVVCEALLSLGTTRLLELVQEAPVPSVGKTMRFALNCTPPAFIVLHDTAERAGASVSRVVQLALVASPASIPPPAF